MTNGLAPSVTSTFYRLAIKCLLVAFFLGVSLPVRVKSHLFGQSSDCPFGFKNEATEALESVPRWAELESSVGIVVYDDEAAAGKQIKAVNNLASHLLVKYELSTGTLDQSRENDKIQFESWMPDRVPVLGSGAQVEHPTGGQWLAEQHNQHIEQSQGRKNRILLILILIITATCIMVALRHKKPLAEMVTRLYSRHGRRGSRMLTAQIRTIQSINPKETMGKLKSRMLTGIHQNGTRNEEKSESELRLADENILFDENYIRSAINAKKNDMYLDVNLI